VLKSMTGFGSGRARTDLGVVSVEIKTVNNKFLAISGHAPEGYQSCLPELEKLIRRRLSRGTVRYWLKVSESTDPGFTINRALLRKYLAELNSVCRDVGVKPVSSVDQLLLLPGVVCQDEDTSERLAAAFPAILELASEALDRLTEARLAEGERLEKDINRRTRNIHQLVDTLAKRAPELTKQFHTMLHKRVSALVEEYGVRVEREDLLKELAYYAQREDIMEEVTRLASHLRQLAATMALDEPVGRKLEFITQEMLREANTMSAKLSDTSLCEVVVDIKAEITRIREQVSNVE